MFLRFFFVLILTLYSIASYASTSYISSDTSFKNGLLVLKTDGKPITGGIKEYYDNEHKLLKREASYKEGKTDGIEKFYYKNGNLQSEGYFKDGLPVGSHKQYHENGFLKREYEDGTFTNYVYYLKGGKIIRTDVIKENSENETTFESYDSAGNLTAKRVASELDLTIEREPVGIGHPSNDEERIIIIH